MTPQQIAALALAAVLVFWMVGAYNRLVALRNVIAEAWAKVQEALSQRAAALVPLVAALRGPLAAEQGALDTLLAAHAEAGHAAAAMAGGPLAPARAQAWVVAESALAAAASRVFALLEQSPEACSEDTVAALAGHWRDGQARLPFARQLFNEAAAAYNAAVGLFPTSLLARLYGFGRAGPV
jgi:LemA protein